MPDLRVPVRLPVRQPAGAATRALGVGFDLPWGAPAGFVTDADGRDRVTDRVARFLAGEGSAVGAVFGSWQPRGRGRLHPDGYTAAWDDFFRHVPSGALRTLHQTAFNLGSLEPYDTARIADFTNALVARHGLAWVNEDLGVWSLHGHPLPYPLPPYLTDGGLAAAVRNTTSVQQRLVAPLVVEFPGFSDGTSVVIGRWHAYDFFRRVAVDTGSPVTLDIGHLLSYQWLRGRRGEDLYAELDRLPLSHCIEVHLSGSALTDGRFHDLHHGVLLDEQFTLLARLLPLLPALRVVTYEDPALDSDGALVPLASDSFIRLRRALTGWLLPS